MATHLSALPLSASTEAGAAAPSDKEVPANRNTTPGNLEYRIGLSPTSSHRSAHFEQCAIEAYS
jgi:hypothetical protein